MVIFKIPWFRRPSTDFKNSNSGRSLVNGANGCTVRVRVPVSENYFLRAISQESRAGNYPSSSSRGYPDCSLSLGCQSPELIGRTK